MTHKLSSLLLQLSEAGRWPRHAFVKQAQRQVPNLLLPKLNQHTSVTAIVPGVAEGAQPELM